MSRQPLQVIPGTVAEALDYAAAHHLAWASYRLVLTLEDLVPDGTYALVGTWRFRLPPAAVCARLAELGIQPASLPGATS